MTLRVLTFVTSLLVFAIVAGGQSIASPLDDLTEVQFKQLVQRCFGPRLANYVDADPNGTINACSQMISIQEAAGSKDKSFKADLLFDRGHAYRKLEKYDLAIRDFSDAIKLNPEGEYYFFLRGTTYAESGDVKKALEDYDRADARTEVDNSGSDRLCASSSRSPKLSLALADCLHARKLLPRDSWVKESLAFTYLRNGKNTKALKLYDELITGDLSSVNKGQAQSLYGRGIARRRSGQTKLGRNDIEKALSLDPTSKEDFKKFGLTP